MGSSFGPQSKDEEIIFVQERLRVDAQHLIFKAMNDKKISKCKLANELGITTKYMKHLLSDNGNLTMRMFAKIMYILYPNVIINIKVTKINEQG